MNNGGIKYDIVVVQVFKIILGCYDIFAEYAPRLHTLLTGFDDSRGFSVYCRIDFIYVNKTHRT